MGRVHVSDRASSIAKPNVSPYYIGLDRALSDPYDPVHNPNGIIQLGLSENRVRFMTSYSYLCIYVLFFPNNETLMY